MLWIFVVLQTMVPFIHAHAGTAQLNHGGLLHIHQGAYADEIYHAITAHEHGAEIDVAQGTPVRKTEPGMLDGVQAAVVNPAPQHAHAIVRQSAPPPSASPPFYFPLPEHTLPHTLAPPFA